MLAYLAVRGEARRDELVDLLWGDMPEAKARNAFRQALHRLRSALGEAAVPLDREQVRLLTDQVAVDRNDFLAAVDGGRWLDAASTYRGDFLEGVELGESRFDEWADAERSRLRGHLQRALHDAGKAAFEAGRWTEALAATRRLVDASPFDEEAALLEAGIHVAAGRASAGAEALRAFTRRLQTELGEPLPTRSRDMLARIERTGTRGEPATPPKGSSVQGEGAAAPSSTFVGREAELARLMTVARSIQEEQGGTLLVLGERGAGKTRLLDETVRRARAFGPVLVLRGRERAGGGAIPYASLAEALRGALRAAGISGASQHLLAEAARLLPELRDMFSLPPLPPVADDTTRVRFFEGVAALVDAVAYERPAILVLDDLHNASTSTIDLLAYLVARLQSSPVLFLCAARADAAEVLAERLGDAGAERIGLSPLSSAETRALLSELLPTESGLASRIDQIADASDGLPMRAIELARRAAAGEAIASPPASVRDILFSRLHACTPSQRRVFFAVALLPRSAPLQLLAAAAHLPEAATFDAAIALERQGFVSQTDAGFVLAHDFTASFVVEQSGPAGRALLAGWAADALAHHGGGAGDAELAHLYAVAGRASEASAHARRAALSAAAAGAGEEAHRLLLQALTFAPDASAAAEIGALLEALGHGRRRLAAGPPTPEDGAAIVPPEAQFPGGENATGAAAPPARSRLLGIRKPIWLTGVATVAALLYLTAIRTHQVRGVGSVLADTLLVARRGSDRAGSAEIVTGDVARNLVSPSGEMAIRHSPAWADSVEIPWVNANPSPDGHWVAVERVARTGTSLYVISADRRDTAAVVAGGGSGIALGWSPDSRALLVSRARALPDGSFDADLYAYSTASRALTPLDTSSARAVSEAAWSPDGSHIAWVARVGAARQQEVFVSRADGAQLQNVSNHRAEDYHIAWSSDGGLVGFTSERAGNAELYAYELGAAHLWRLTNDPAHDDRVAFAPDGQSVAFESTRGGQAGVYLMPTLGGTTRRVDGGGDPLALVGWRGRPIPYPERLRIVGGNGVRQGDTLSLGLVALDQTGAPFALRDIEWSLLDSGHVRFVPPGADSSSLSRRIVGVRDGFASVITSIPGWRSDTLSVRVGAGSLELLSDDFARGIDTRRWQSLGVPAPAAGTLAGVPVLVPNGDLEWESGVLSRALLPLQPGMRVQARLFAPFSAHTLPNSSVTLALVVPPEARPDSIAPQFVSRVSLVWNGESGRLTYAVDRESRSEPAAELGSAASHLARIVIERDARVAFYVDGALRWRSTLRLTGMSSDGRTRLWIASRATDARAAVAAVQVIVEE